MTAEDVTAGRALERARQQAEKMETIGRLTGGIAQEFNKVLTAIRAHASALAESLPASPPELRRELAALTEDAQRATELAHKLLGFSRHKKLDLQPLSLTDYVREVLDELRRLLPANVEVQFESDQEGGV